MERQASTDRDLARAGKNQMSTALRLLAIGGAGLVVGLVLWLINTELTAFFGMAIGSLAMIPTIVGLGLLLSALVAGRASKRKPFA